MVAFVVAVDSYKVHKGLKNPVSDAEAIRRALESQNVEVYYVYDCDSAEFWHRFALFEAALRTGDAAFFYFAGHGVTFRN